MDMYHEKTIFLPCGLSQLIAMRYGTIPVVNETGGLKDTVIPFDGNNGTGFTFQSFCREDLLDALTRCITVYREQPENWKKAVVNSMKYDSSWDKPAREYMDIYFKHLN